MATVQNAIELTLYLVGYDEDSALAHMPFDSYESADSYAQDQAHFIPNIYAVNAYIDPSTIELITQGKRKQPLPKLPTPNAEKG